MSAGSRVETRYWVMRTDKRNAPALADELREGKLRQGWGWLPEQDLRTIANTRLKGAALTEEQQQTWRGNRRLLETEPDSVQIGDLIITPHLPKEGVWSVVRVAGPYSYDISKVVSDKGKDFGHVRRVELLTPENGVSPSAERVSALLRKTMRNQSRMWNIDALGAEVERLLTMPPEDEESEEVADRPILDSVLDSLWKSLQQRFHGAEFEGPCLQLLEVLFGPENVERTAGSGERGADAICTFVDPLGVQHRTAIQVKMWEGAIDSTRPLDQLAVAFVAYDGITSGVIFTTASSVSDKFQKGRRDMEAKIGKPIQVVLRDQVLRLFLSHLADLLDE